MRIERQDKQPEPREEEIQQGWRAWARRNDFTQVDPVQIKAGTLSVSLEVWELGDAGLLYLPLIPRAEGGGRTLYR